MKTKLFTGMIIAAMLLITSNYTYAQDHVGHPDVIINVNSDFPTCDFEISSALTQNEFKVFTKQLGHIAYFNPMASAKPLGVMKFDITLDFKVTAIDQTAGAWNNTFAHPDFSHYLGDAIVYPGLHARMGVSKKVDLGIYFTHAGPSGANYGFIGGELKYAFLNNNGWAASARGSFMQIIGVKDFNFSNYGLDVSASKSLGIFTPYIGVATTLSHSKEFTDKVDLSNENILDARVIAGAELRYKFINIGAEVDFSELTTFGIKLGATF